MRALEMLPEHLLSGFHSRLVAAIPAGFATEAYYICRAGIAGWLELRCVVNCLRWWWRLLVLLVGLLIVPRTVCKPCISTLLVQQLECQPIVEVVHQTVCKPQIVCQSHTQCAQQTVCRPLTVRGLVR